MYLQQLFYCSIVMGSKKLKENQRYSSDNDILSVYQY